MKQILAIQGHPTRGKEVIKIFEMLGGNNRYHLHGTDCNSLYTIREKDDVIIGTYPTNRILQIYALEEFLKKYPFKVEDKVQHKGSKSCGSIYKIQKMIWENNQIKYIIYDTCCDKYNFKVFIVTAEDLQPYKEKSMEEKDEESVNHVFDREIISFDIAQRDKYELDLQGKFNVVLREGKYYVERIKPKYPKTYEECCDVISINRHDVEIDIPQPYQKNMFHFFKLLICRDAYWKIAGEEMGLGKSWEPNWTTNEGIPAIFRFRYNIAFDSIKNQHCLLVFPTKKMRDSFFKNFKDLIETCKDFL